MARIGVVAIGRNEGERLRLCLTSLDPKTLPVVYVDSGSSDGSVETARASALPLSRSIFPPPSRQPEPATLASKNCCNITPTSNSFSLSMATAK